MIDTRVGAHAVLTISIVFASTLLHGQTRAEGEDGATNEPRHVRVLDRPRRITHMEINESFARWSPNGQRIAFVAYDPTLRQTTVWIMDGLEAEPRQIGLTHPGNVHVDWTSDSSLVFDIHGLDEPPMLYLHDLNNNLSRRLTHPGAVEMYPDCARTDGRIVFASAQKDGLDLMVMDREHKQRHRLTTLAGDQFQPRWSPDGRKVVFFSATGAEKDLWTIEVESGELTRITTHPAHDDYGTWSPDGRLIAFESTRSGRRDIWVVPATGGTPQRLTFGQGRNAKPSWSPDGTKIIFSSDRAGTGDLWMLTVAPEENGAEPRRGQEMAPRGATPGCASGELRRLTSAATEEYYARWSPDGERIAFTAYDPTKRQSTVWMLNDLNAAPEQVGFSRAGDLHVDWAGDAALVIDVHGPDEPPFLCLHDLRSGRTRRLTPRGAVELHPACARGSRKIVFASASDRGLDLAIMDLEQERRRRLTDLAGDESHPSWSADGTKIVFLSETEAGQDLWMTRVEDGHLSRITTHPASDDNGTWSPDGRLIAFESSRSGQRDIWVISEGGGAPQRLTSAPGRDGAPRWSPDGARILFSSDRAGSNDIWMLTLASKAPMPAPGQNAGNPPPGAEPSASPDE